MHMQGGPRGFVTFCNRMVVFGKVTTLLKFVGTLIGMKGQWPTDLSYTDDCAACEDENFISLVQKKVFLV